MSINAYLNFRGNAGSAMTFYKEVFETEPMQVMYYKDMPADPAFSLSKEMENFVMHAVMPIAGTLVMFSDAPPITPLNIGNNISLLIMSKDPDELTRYFERLKVNGQVLMPLEPTFFSKLYGNVIDQFGIGWQLYLEE